MLATDSRASQADATASAGVLVRQDATLTVAQRAAGMPTSTAAGRQLTRATIKIETTGQGTSEPKYFVDAGIDLAGEPGGDPDAELNLGFGHREGSACNLVSLLNSDTSYFWGTRYDFTGYNPDYFSSPSRPWDCVAVYLDNSFGGSPATQTYDALVGSLTDTRHSPRLRITKVDLLGQKLGNLKLVRGVPTRVEVSFRNAGKVSSAKINVKGSGKGLRVNRQKSRKLSDGSSTSVSLPVRLVGRQKRTRLRIVVSDGKVKAVRTLRVTRVKPPRRPVSGSYRSPTRSVKFTIRRGRIIGWFGTMLTRCGGFPDLFRYSTNSYSFPRVKIPRNGIVQANDRGELYSVSLRLKVVGAKVTRGHFAYYGPDRCYASVSFNAKRTGR